MDDLEKLERLKDLVVLLGLKVDLDKWEDSGWIRITDSHVPKMQVSLLFKDDSYEESVMQLGNYLRQSGETRFKLCVNSLFSLD
jgi:hypothetical protein